MAAKQSNYSKLLQACTRNTRNFQALSCELELEPQNGFESRQMPPSYAAPKGTTDDEKAKHGPYYHIEDRYSASSPSGTEKVVVLDSIQSCANRMRRATLAAKLLDEFPLPTINLSIGALDNAKYDLLQLSYGVFSPYVRDAIYDGKKLIDHEIFKDLRSCNTKVAMQALVKWDPFLVASGVYASNLGNGQRAFRVPRSFVNEVFGGFISHAKRTGGRNDDIFFIEKKAGKVKYNQSAPWEFELVDTSEKTEKNPKEGKPCVAEFSSIGYGPIPPNCQRGGVFVKWIKDSFFLGLHSLNNTYALGSPKEDAPVRAFLAAMALHAHYLKTQTYELRSGCSLSQKSLTGVNTYKVKGSDDAIELNEKTAYDLYMEAMKNQNVVDHRFRLDIATSEKTNDITNRSKGVHDDNEE